MCISIDWDRDTDRMDVDIMFESLDCRIDRLSRGRWCKCMSRWRGRTRNKATTMTESSDQRKRQRSLKRKPVYVRGMSTQKSLFLHPTRVHIDHVSISHSSIMDRSLSSDRIVGVRLVVTVCLRIDTMERKYRSIDTYRYIDNHWDRAGATSIAPLAIASQVISYARGSTGVSSSLEWYSFSQRGSVLNSPCKWHLSRQKWSSVVHFAIESLENRSEHVDASVGMHWLRSKPFDLSDGVGLFRIPL
jgi:hypothetical protein